MNLSKLPSGGLLAHLLAMIVGILLTVIMQSSSAAVATTLTALYSGVVNFDQAASLVIGAAIGTTVTGALAAIGGSVPAKRTALAHVIFNLASGLIAVICLPVFLRLISWAQENFGLDPGATSLAAFHTLFIGVGVLIFLPFVDFFASFITRLLPDRGPILTSHLDDTLLNMPPVALEATRRCMTDTAGELFRLLEQSLAAKGEIQESAQRLRVQEALIRTRDFLARIPVLTDFEPVSRGRVYLLHAIDHLTRLETHFDAPPGMTSPGTNEILQDAVRRCRQILQTGYEGLLSGQPGGVWLETIQKAATELANERRQERASVLEESAQGVWKPDQGLELLDAMRWLDRIGYHTWRASHYLGQAAMDSLTGKSHETAKSANGGD
ncbi:Na/Pi cotransporter family protein [Geitlerinema calcuttense]|uniref:Na/Pi symporter n=1 Tax=Geitlerinema calcuttense NRMC-F 0142 TaxID=2922238 RepID=A0ABT7LY24_9CYAN|nr:Na/Pi symporter [Geitlerinema calcuttense]MDL5056916.1 Na/Pi symporter [Geitlerinema calcuttense NRMC-F 0142]